MKTIIFTVTNDLSYDQRMIRICSSLSQAGYKVLLIGVKKRNSIPLQQRPFEQKRIGCFFTRGPGFYAEYNTRLFFSLLFKKSDILCCIDVDTILPVWMASKLKNIKRIYDAHEYFSQQKEIITRPGVYKIWHWIEKTFVPKFPKGYTVSNTIATEFYDRYGVNYDVIRNIPLLKTAPILSSAKEKIILYQGAVNESRGFEFLIPAMKTINSKLFIYGDGNFLEQTKNLIAANNLQDKVLLRGKLLPEELEKITPEAYIGINFVEYIGLNQYFSLANKFFDYIQHCVPQVTMNFPEYKRINNEFEVAVLINDLHIETITVAINSLLNDDNLYKRLQQNCLKAREELNWQNEEKKLIEFYHNNFNR